MKHFIIDTNIILDDAENIFTLCENGENKLIITETILEELDKFKSGFGEINYQARKFNRMLADSKIITQNPLTVKINNCEIIILQNSSNNEKPDLQIIETSIEFATKNDIKNITFISNDLLFRTFVTTKGYIAEPFFNSNKEIKKEFFKEFSINEVLPNKDYFNLENLGLEIPKHISSIKINDANGKPFYFTREDKNTFKKLDDKSSVNLYKIKPKNTEQQIFIEHSLNQKNDIVVCNAKAGSGKTLLALVSAMKLKEKGLIDKIIYVRKTIISGDKTDELGFLPGKLDEKINGYIYPLRDNIEMLIRLKNKRKKHWTKEEISNAITDFENKYNIEYIYEGHLRGRTLSIKSLIIWDEAQNDTLAGIKTLLSRIPDSSRIVILGSLNQIDNNYVNKFNNALSFMLNNCGYFNSIQIQGCNLNKIYRGKIAEWIENQKI